MAKFCENCGAMLEDTALGCGRCGKACNSGMNNLYQSGGYYPQQTSQNYSPQGYCQQGAYGGNTVSLANPSESKRSKKIVIILAVIIVLLGIGVVGELFVFRTFFSNPFEGFKKSMNKRQIVNVLGEGKLDNEVYCQKYLYGREGNVYVHVDSYDSKIVNNVVWSTVFDTEADLEDYRDNVESKLKTMSVKPEYIVVKKTLKLVFAFDHDYRTAFNAYFDALNEKNFEKMYNNSVSDPEDTEITSNMTTLNDSFEEVMAEIMDDIEDKYSYTLGEDIRWTYEVKEVTEVSESTRKVIIDQIAKGYGNDVTDNITEIKEANLTVKLAGKDDEKELKSGKAYVVKDKEQVKWLNYLETPPDNVMSEIIDAILS